MYWQRCKAATSVPEGHVISPNPSGSLHTSVALPISQGSAAEQTKPLGSLSLLFNVRLAAQLPVTNAISHLSLVRAEVPLYEYVPPFAV